MTSLKKEKEVTIAPHVVIKLDGGVVTGVFFNNSAIKEDVHLSVVDSDINGLVEDDTLCMDDGPAAIERYDANRYDRDNVYGPCDFLRNIEDLNVEME